MSQRLNDYANSMFRYEALHDEWIQSCTNYCKGLFGERIKGKVVLDYAFGRGNWSLALLGAGAAKVYAVDASADNVERFKKYIKQAGLQQNIIPLHGNLLEAEIPIKADILWLYGILHHIQELDSFLDKLKTLRTSPKALLYAYYYADFTPRAFLVRLARTLLCYESEAQFRADEPAFSRYARIRARDDLVAPFVDFLGAAKFCEVLKSHSIMPIRQDEDFHKFQRGRQNCEFVPHQFLCSWDPEEVLLETPNDAVRVAESDLHLLEDLGRAVVQRYVDTEDRRRIVIGLFNTEFPCSSDWATTGDLVFEVALYLVNLIRQRESREPLSKVATDFMTILNSLAVGGQNISSKTLDNYPGSEAFSRASKVRVRL